MSGDVYGGWQPSNLLELAQCEADPYITPAGVTPAWVLELHRAARGAEVVSTDDSGPEGWLHTDAGYDVCMECRS